MEELLTSRLMPPCSRTTFRARLNFATWAKGDHGSNAVDLEISPIVTAARHFKSLSGSSSSLTIVCNPPRSAIFRRMYGLVEISLRMCKEPIWSERSAMLQWTTVSFAQGTLQSISSVSSKFTRTSNPPTSRMANWQVSTERLKSRIDDNAMTVAVGFPP